MIIIDKSTNPQGRACVGRLIIKNESNVRAIDVEAYVESISDNEGERKNYLSIPLNWTHGQIDKSKIRRDISGNQSVYLDIFHYEIKKDSLIFKLMSPIYVKEYCDIKPGRTELNIKIYQESGQVVDEIVTIIWEDGKKPEIII